MSEHEKIKAQIIRANNRSDRGKILFYLRETAIHGEHLDEIEELDLLVYSFKHSTDALSESEMVEWKGYLQRLTDRIYSG